MNHNRKRLKMKSGTWVSMPEEYELKKTDEENLMIAAEGVSAMTGRIIHAIHLNQDQNDKEKLHSVNIVLHREE